MAQEPIRRTRRRPPAQLAKLNKSPSVGRFAIVNHFQRVKSRLAETSKFPALASFLPQNLWPWISSYLKYAFTPRFPFPKYSAPGGGVYRLGDAGSVTIAIAGDWGTGTQEAQTVMDLMVKENPDLTVHLGDVYFVGDDQELAENCFGQSSAQFTGVVWRHGSQGSFALNGNHEMYANGKPYFTRFLPSLGMKSSPGQIASFFCLEAGGWRIIAIDTGYNSVGLPIFSLIPGLDNIPFVGGDCHLERALLDWLKESVKPLENPRPTVILSHHQYFSAFGDHAYTKPATQLREFFPTQEVIWIWGHEHRLAIYDKFSKDGGVTAFGRCLGHGGMPVELGTPKDQPAPQLYDARVQILSDGTAAGKNGFVLVTIEQDVLTLDYRDIDNTRLLVERFSSGPGGALQRTFDDPGILRKP